MNAQGLLAVLEETWHELDGAINGLDEAAMAEPGVVETWSVKDVLGHVAAWEQMAVRHLEQWHQDAALSNSGGPEVDSYNAAESTRRRDWSIEEVRAEVDATRAKLRAALEHMDDAAWTAPVSAGEWRSTLGELIGGDLGGPVGPGTHAAEHAQHIREWRHQRAGSR